MPRTLRLTASQAAALQPQAVAAPVPARKPRPFRLTRPAPLEADVQSAIGKYLDLLVARRQVLCWWRQNGGGTMLPGKGGKPRWLAFYTLHGFGPPRSKGLSDIGGILAPQPAGSVGRVLAIEVKRRGEVATSEQREYLDCVAAGGGVAVVAYCVEDVARAIG